MQGNVDLEVNENEVKSVKYLGKEELKTFIGEWTDNSDLRTIVKVYVTPSQIWYHFERF